MSGTQGKPPEGKQPQGKQPVDALTALSQQIDARLRQFKENGAFTDADSPTLAALTDSRRQAQAKLQAAVARGDAAEATWRELQQDFDEVAEQITTALHGLEARAMKRRS